jgi:hypothetical protein
MAPGISSGPRVLPECGPDLVEPGTGIGGASVEVEVSGQPLRGFLPRVPLGVQGGLVAEHECDREPFAGRPRGFGPAVVVVPCPPGPPGDVRGEAGQFPPLRSAGPAKRT